MLVDVDSNLLRIVQICNRCISIFQTSNSRLWRRQLGISWQDTGPLARGLSDCFSKQPHSQEAIDWIFSAHTRYNFIESQKAWNRGVEIVCDSLSGSALGISNFSLPQRIWGL